MYQSSIYKILCLLQSENISGALVQSFCRILLQVIIVAGGLQDNLVFPGFDLLQVSSAPVGQSSQYQGWDGEGGEEEGGEGEKEGGQQ